MQTSYQAIIPAPFGALGVRMVSGRLTGLEFLPVGAPLRKPMDEAMAKVCRQLSEYLIDPSASLDIPLQLHGTSFQQRVWQALQAIPCGTTQTYSELAMRVGSGARAVANACGANPVALVIPCHRVVAKHGLGGFMQGRVSESLLIKEWLLRHERRVETSA